ncbi:hypothetical protein HYH02_012499 [Chlamydomonas schloesseri]|uniref:Uncharacterized protein n=1 Tax=Chlamydomonas schloesseri TaxID=2026947 RepID=A0A835T503_9CHLO|nr:hypothetical protein HYH02_012499 [Chlamydomonas schloesseri]|eukprot:KAG2433954.1 hypothetical protein HYH02_012499 [Chlamydomonas schloesseri]
MWYMYRVYCRRDRTVYFRYGRNSSVWARILAAPLNNYLVRSLAGEHVFNLPSGAVTAEHAAVAQNILLTQFDVLLVMEDRQLSDAALSYGLGWAERWLHVNAAATRAWRTNESLPNDPEALLPLNQLDTELFAVGAVAAQLDGMVYSAAGLLGIRGGDGVLQGMPLRRLHAREYAPPSMLTPAQREVVRCGIVGRQAHAASSRGGLGP